LFGEAGMVAQQLIVFLLQRIAFGFGAALLRCQGLAHARFALAPPGGQQRRVQPLAAEQCSDATGAFGSVGFRQDVVFVLGGLRTPYALQSVSPGGGAITKGASDIMNARSSGAIARCDLRGISNRIAWRLCRGREVAAQCRRPQIA
jgi:hypothetical protein